MSANWWGISATIVAWMGVLVILLALVGPWIMQRIKRRKRCPKCWYDMSHSPTMTCSECGYATTRERKLYKARRRWKLAFLGGFMLIGAYALNVTPAIKDRGWPAAAPTTALIVAVPWLEIPVQQQADADPVRTARLDLLNELLQRISGESLSWWQRHALVRWTVVWTDDTGVDAPSDASAFVLDVATRYRGETHPAFLPERTLEKCLALLRRRTVSQLIEVREHWPCGHPVEVVVRRSKWFTRPGNRIIYVTPLLDGAEVLSRRTWEHRDMLARALPTLDEERFSLGVLPDEARAIDFRVEVARHPRNSPIAFDQPPPLEDLETVWIATVSKPIRFADRLSDVIEHVPSKEMETLLHERTSIQHNSDRADHLWKVVVVRDVHLLRHERLAFAGKVRVLHNEDIVAEGSFLESPDGRHFIENNRWLPSWAGWSRWEGPKGVDLSQPILGQVHVNMSGDLSRILEADPDDPAWRIVIQADPALALRGSDITRCWFGKVEAPLRMRSVTPR